MSGIETDAIENERLARELRQFVEIWAPEDRTDRYRFQQDLMCLFVTAMSSQRATLSRGIEFYAADVFVHRSMSPLNVIFEHPTKERK